VKRPIFWRNLLQKRGSERAALAYLERLKVEHGTYSAVAASLGVTRTQMETALARFRAVCMEDVIPDEAEIMPLGEEETFFPLLVLISPRADVEGTWRTVR